MSVAPTPHLGLQILEAAQLQKHVTVNEALTRLDLLAQIAVESRAATAPPASPVEGGRWLVAGGGSGAWAGEDGTIAAWLNGGWDFITPVAGMLIWVEDEALLLVHDGATLHPVMLQGASQLGINTTADAVNRLAVKSDAVLLSHDDVTPGTGAMRLTLNKSGAPATASTLFQTAYTGHAEFGLLGTNDLALQVSPDAATRGWTSAMTVNRHSGRAVFRTIQNGPRPWNVVLRNHVTGSAWQASTSAADNGWLAMCWSPERGLFCAVSISGSGNRVMTSPDGITWTIRTSAADNAWHAVCWSPELGLFCAVAYTGSGNRVMTSPDGITWTTRTSAANNSWYAVCWSPELGLFCAVADTGTGNRVMTSPDGITWTARTSAADNGWVGVCWSGELGLFCAVAYTGTGNRVMTSPDGIAWTLQASAADNQWYAVCWSPELGLFCAAAISGSGDRIMTSPDGVTWTARTSAADNTWHSVCWSPELGLFCAVAYSGSGNRVMTSPDGITWTTGTSAADNSWRAVCWAPELGLFGAIAYTGSGDRAMTSVSAHSFPYRG